MELGCTCNAGYSGNISASNVKPLYFSGSCIQSNLILLSYFTLPPFYIIYLDSFECIYCIDTVNFEAQQDYNEPVVVGGVTVTMKDETAVELGPQVVEAVPEDSKRVEL